MPQQLYFQHLLVQLIPCNRKQKLHCPWLRRQMQRLITLTAPNKEPASVRPAKGVCSFLSFFFFSIMFDFNQSMLKMRVSKLEGGQREFFSLGQISGLFALGKVSAFQLFTPRASGSVIHHRGYYCNEVILFQDAWQLVIKLYFQILLFFFQIDYIWTLRSCHEIIGTIT